MNKILAFLLAFLFCTGAANAQWSDGAFQHGSGGSSTPFTPTPFTPPSYVTLTDAATLCDDSSIVVSPDGLYAYTGVTLTSNSHGAIIKTTLATGVQAVLDLGASTQPAMFLLNSAGTHLYCFNASSSATYWDIATPGLTVAHTAALAVAPAFASQPAQIGADLSPDGTTIAYVSGANQKIYKINTTTYAVTNFNVGHSAGAANTLAICFYDSDSTELYVSYAGTADIDLYIAGVWGGAITPPATGTPQFKFMRSGVSTSLFVSDTAGGHLFVNSVNGAIAIPVTVNGLWGMSISSHGSYDIALINVGAVLYEISDNNPGPLLPIPVPLTLASAPGGPQYIPGAAITNDLSGTIYAVGSNGSALTLNSLSSALPPYVTTLQSTGANTINVGASGAVGLTGTETAGGTADLFDFVTPGYGTFGLTYQGVLNCPGGIAGAGSQFGAGYFTASTALQCYTGGTGVTWLTGIDGHTETNMVQTVVNGSAGTLSWTQTETGTAYKRVVIFLNGYSAAGTTTITFPAAFASAPLVVTGTQGIAASAATTTTSTTTAVVPIATLDTGFIIIEGN